MGVLDPKVEIVDEGAPTAHISSDTPREGLGIHTKFTRSNPPTGPPRSECKPPTGGSQTEEEEDTERVRGGGRPKWAQGSSGADGNVLESADGGDGDGGRALQKCPKSLSGALKVGGFHGVQSVPQESHLKKEKGRPVSTVLTEGGARTAWGSWWDGPGCARGWSGTRTDLGHAHRSPDVAGTGCRSHCCSTGQGQRGLVKWS